MTTAAQTFPVTVLIDHRENMPYAFTGLRTDAKDGRRPLMVPTRRAALATGDYSLENLTDLVAIERKGLPDLFSTLGQGRDRFERELQRLDGLRFAAVIVEADWLRVLRDPPENSRLNPKTIFRSVIAWQQRFPRCHWWFCGDRRLAEVVTFRILERFLKEHRSHERRTQRAT
jgi:ERCC4-type nuclease